MKTKTKKVVIRPMPRAALEHVRGGDGSLEAPTTDDPTEITQPLKYKLVYNRAS